MSTSEEVPVASPGPGFGKRLAHVEKRVRDDAVLSLTKYMESRPDISDLQMMKLWKAMFYCFWMSDKPPVQQHLADRLAGMVESLPGDLGLRFLEAFWNIIAAEWNGIDRIRLDKFYLLMRKMHFYAFRLLEKNDFRKDYVDAFVAIMKEGPLSPRNSKFPDGIRYHTCEVYVNELDKSLQGELSLQNGMALLSPFFDLIATTIQPTVAARVKSEVFEAILARADDDFEFNGYEDEEMPSKTSSFDLVAITKRLFLTAAKPSTTSGNRQIMYALFEQYAKVTGVDTDGLLESAAEESEDALKEPDTTADDSASDSPSTAVPESDHVPSGSEAQVDDAPAETAVPTSASKSKKKKKNKNKNGQSRAAEAAADAKTTPEPDTEPEPHKTKKPAKPEVDSDVQDEGTSGQTAKRKAGSIVAPKSVPAKKTKASHSADEHQSGDRSKVSTTPATTSASSEEAPSTPVEKKSVRWSGKHHVQFFDKTKALLSGSSPINLLPPPAKAALKISSPSPQPKKLSAKRAVASDYM
ncbi:nucleolar protein,Nop52-domain-containing protein [Polychytrium aggregatum]|uniref:nucleolar protein,Nop52-domain-containing protein n=1 Tax=Polychytrium aggregatum TaxID=110093 RepID=UPI0022FE27B0|nr:nucleolar protein,Nop52-domain-containing protein [Polychytrium aggregatum]KAI9192929.1 nucleolar protein,Nop52-domain-containing protein [Polychytrium aggregatum]